MNKKLSVERNKQVQFRMPEKTHKKMKVALTKNDTGFADFFNEVSEAYLKNPKEFQKAINFILGKKGE